MIGLGLLLWVLDTNVRPAGATPIFDPSSLAALIPLIIFLGAIALYLLPTIVAHNRKATIRGTATVINIFLGWTVLGWVVALAMAIWTYGAEATGRIFDVAHLDTGYR